MLWVFFHSLLLSVTRYRIALVRNYSWKPSSDIMSKLSSRLSEPFTKLDLRFKVALVFALPFFALVIYLSYDQYRVENGLLMKQAQSTATQLGGVVLSSLSHSMLLNDRATLSSAIHDIGGKENIQRVSIVNLNGEVRESNIPSEVGQKLSTSTTGCVECHQLPAGKRPVVLSTLDSNGQLRVAIPIANEADCQKCHGSTSKNLGMLLVDVSVSATQTDLRKDLRTNLVWSFVIAGLAIIGGLLLVNWLVVRRVEVLHKTFNAFEDGDLTARVDKSWQAEDEITRLAQSFNRMADSLVRHEDEQHGLSQMRQQAIIEERERIARELHDGVAQFIGYVNTKVLAVRQLLKQNKLEEADQLLVQIEQAVQDQSNDVRASIIGLKLASESGTGLAADLRLYVTQSNRLSGFVIELRIDPRAEDFQLDADAELHLLRIVQEAISNVRKHASAREAQVILEREDEELVLQIRDDGVGFSPWQWSGESRGHFGLQTMQERAEAIGAVLHVESAPGQGTAVTIRMKVRET
jgi:signal transduction histidine kinase